MDHNTDDILRLKPNHNRSGPSCLSYFEVTGHVHSWNTSGSFFLSAYNKLLPLTPKVWVTDVSVLLREVLRETMDNDELRERDQWTMFGNEAEKLEIEVIRDQHMVRQRVDRMVLRKEVKLRSRILQRKYHTINGGFQTCGEPCCFTFFQTE